MKTWVLIFMLSSVAPRLGYGLPMSLESPPTPPESSTRIASGSPGETGHALRMGNREHPEGRNTSDLHRDHGRPSAGHQPPTRARIVRTNRPMQLGHTRQRPLTGNGLHSLGLAQPQVGQNGGLTRNGPVHNGLPVRKSNAIRPPGASGDNLSHPRQNPAVIGGPLRPCCGDVRGIHNARTTGKP